MEIVDGVVGAAGGFVVVEVVVEEAVIDVEEVMNVLLVVEEMVDKIGGVGVVVEGVKVAKVE